MPGIVNLDNLSLNAGATPTKPSLERASSSTGTSKSKGGTEPVASYNHNAFAGLDGFSTAPQPMGGAMGAPAPPSAKANPISLASPMQPAAQPMMPPAPPAGMPMQSPGMMPPMQQPGMMQSPGMMQPGMPMMQPPGMMQQPMQQPMQQQGMMPGMMPPPGGMMQQQQPGMMPQPGMMQQQQGFSNF